MALLFARRDAPVELVGRERARVVVAVRVVGHEAVLLGGGGSGGGSGRGGRWDE